MTVDPWSKWILRMTPPPTSFENTLGPYRLLRVIGEGGMGTVYLGLDEALNRHVAIKVLRVAPDNPRAAAMTRRFMREAQSAAKLNHPNVVTIHAVVRQTDRALTRMLSGRARHQPQLIE